MQNYKILFLSLLLIVGLNVFVSPSEFYSGDSVAIKLTAINLIKNHEWGIKKSEESLLKNMLTIKGQYFHYNTNDQKFYPRWGFFNTTLSAIPEFFISHPNTPLDSVPQNSILAHNFFNIVISIFIALYLFFISSLYTQRLASKIIFLFSVLYSTFAFNYLRAQSYEIFQLLFFLIFYYYFILEQKSKSLKYTILWNLALMALILVKDYFILLYIPIALYYLLYKKPLSQFIQSKYFFVSFFWSIATLFIIIFTNKLHYQEYFFTAKASYDPYNSAIIPFSISYFPERLFDYFLNSRASILFYFPVLIFSILGFSNFKRLFKKDLIFIFCIFAITFFPLLMFYSFGESCYGPRHLLFILPVLCLPFLSFLDHIIYNFTYLPRKLVLLIPLVFMLAYSTYLEMVHNSRPFFSNYILGKSFKQFTNDEANHYFKSVHPAIVIKDYNNFINDNVDFYPFTEVIKNLNEQEKQNLKQRFTKFAESALPCNFYFKISCEFFGTSI